jgi:hydroxymethylbilane synthase
MSPPFLKIGTRGSPLALAQSNETRHRLAEAHHIDESRIEIVVIRTTGDMIQDRALSESGGKGLFTRELDAAQLAGDIDIAVHSSKDLPTALPDGLVVAGCLPREDPRDAFISTRAARLRELPHGATLGTASLRRGAMALRLRPDLKITLLRGNVETRLRKVESGEIDATLLALAGLKRLGFDHRATSILDTDEFLPAVGQGAIAITTRADDHATRVALGAILDARTTEALTAERSFLTVLDGSCRTPIGGHATIANGVLSLRGLVLKPDGSQAFDIADSGPADDAERIGVRAGRALLERMPANFLA